MPKSHAPWKLFKTAECAVGAAQPSGQRTQFIHAMLQAKLIWSPLLSDHVAESLHDLSSDQVREIFRTQETFLHFAKRDERQTAASSESKTASQLHSRQDPLPHLRHNCMARLRQRVLDLRPYGIEQLFVLLDTLPTDEISALVRMEGDLQQSLQALFPHYSIWPYTPPSQNQGQNKTFITTQDALTPEFGNSLV